MKRIKLLSIIAVLFMTTMLCGLIPYPSWSKITAIAEEESAYYVHLGGEPIGISIQTKGVYIDEIVQIITEKGGFTPALDAGLQVSDKIISINGILTEKAEDVSKIVADNKDGKPLTIQVKRNGELINTIITPMLDVTIHAYKLGLLLKTDLSGLGTLTYIKADSGRFGCLGHKIFDPTAMDTEYEIGDVYPATIIGIDKGNKAKVGGLRGKFSKESEKIGSIDKNTPYGVFGFATKDYAKSHSLVAIGYREEIKTGKAYVYTTVSDKKDSYEIEIIKTNQQKAPDEKGLVIRITDKRLIDMTGGIVQGMSGSPIVQNGKLIAAVSHVFSTEPTLGYGMYLDFMINN